MHKLTLHFSHSVQMLWNHIDVFLSGVGRTKWSILSRASCYLILINAANCHEKLLVFHLRMTNFGTAIVTFGQVVSEFNVSFRFFNLFLSQRLLIICWIFIWLNNCFWMLNMNFLWRNFFLNCNIWNLHASEIR